MCNLDVRGRLRRNQHTFVSRCKIEAKAGGSEERSLSKAVGRESEGIEMVWKGLKDCLLDVADEVCGRTTGHTKHSQTCWGNDEVAELISEKKG